MKQRVLKIEQKTVFFILYVFELFTFALKFTNYLSIQ